MNSTNASTHGAELKISVSAGGLRPKILYGLPCANCRCYYRSDLALCPICQCGERVSGKSTFTRLAATF